MEQILTSKYIRRYFYLLTFFLVLSLLIIRLFLLPKAANYLGQYFEIINTILDAILSTGISTVIIATLAFWLTPRVVKNSQMNIIAPKEIKDYLDKARDTDEYWFSGGTGSFTRTVTLPKLASNARYSNFSKRIVLLLIDPDNKLVCDNYVRYRNKVRTGSENTWDERNLRRKIYSTIVSAYIYKKEQPLLDITVGLQNNYSIFRVDLSTKLLVITKEDPHEPALMCDSDTFFFKSFLEDLRLSLRQSQILSGDIEGILFSELNTASVKKLISDLKLDSDHTLNDDDFTEIIKIIKGAKNPYGY